MIHLPLFFIPNLAQKSPILLHSHSKPVNDHLQVPAQLLSHHLCIQAKHHDIEVIVGKVGATLNHLPHELGYVLQTSVLLFLVVEFLLELLKIDDM